MSQAATPFRKPSFLSAVGSAAPHAAQFGGARDVKPEPVLQVVPPPMPGPTAPSAAQQASAQAEREAQLERVTAAVELLRSQSERLAEQARADAVEIAFQVARRILDDELEARPDAVFGLVRSAVRRLGETRKVTVHLSPRDAERVQALDADAASRALAVSQVEIAADPSLQNGDCVVEGAGGRVDGRLAGRLAELRANVERALTDEGTGA